MEIQGVLATYFWSPKNKPIEAIRSEITAQHFKTHFEVERAKNI